MVSLSGLLMLELPTEVPELDDSATAAPLLASVTANVLIVISVTFKVNSSLTVVTPSVAVTVKVWEVLVS